MKGIWQESTRNQENIQNSVFDFDHWKPGTSTVEGYDNDRDGIRTYRLSGLARPLMRHELKLVKGSEAQTLIRRRLTKKASPKYEVQ